MAAMFLPYLAPLRYGRGHSLAVYLDHIHYSCTQLLSLLAIVSCPLQSLYTMLAASDHDNMPSWEMWLHHITELFQDSVLKSHHVPVCGQYFNSDNLLHCALALDVSSLEIVQLLLSNDCYISKLLVCAINIQQQIADAVLGILEACWNCPSALSVVFQHHLKTRQSRAEFSLSTIMENTVIGSWILAHFQEITHLALHYGEAAYYLIQSDRDQSKTKESNYANAFTKEVKECIKSFHLPFVLALRKLCGELNTIPHCCKPIEMHVHLSQYFGLFSALTSFWNIMCRVLCCMHALLSTHGFYRLSSKFLHTYKSSISSLNVNITQLDCTVYNTVSLSVLDDMYVHNNQNAFILITFCTFHL